MNQTLGLDHLVHHAALTSQHVLQLAGKHQIDLGADNHEAHVRESGELRNDGQPVQELLHDALVVVQYAVHNHVHGLPRRHEELVRCAVLQLPRKVPERKLQIGTVPHPVENVGLEVVSKRVHSDASSGLLVRLQRLLCQRSQHGRFTAAPVAEEHNLHGT